MFHLNDNFELLDTLELPLSIREGWGLSHYKDFLLVSDGSEKVHFLDTLTFEITRSLTVKGRLGDSEF